jgi:hypothetical protein
MTLKSALQDVKETTLAAITGLLGKLAYLASLRRGHGAYQHWGISLVHGPESSERALKAAHGEVLSEVLRTPMVSLVEDLHRSSQGLGVPSQTYVTEMQEQFVDLLPGERKDTPAGKHLNSVLVALSNLEQNRGRATRSTS